MKAAPKLVYCVCLLVLMAGHVKGALSQQKNSTAPEMAKTYAIESPKLPENAVITAFQVDVRYGTIIAISGIPAGWGFKVVNEPEWGDQSKKTMINAFMIMGPLRPKDLRRICFRIAGSNIDGLHLSLSGSLATNLLPDLDHDGSVTLGPRNFEIAK